jgi:hypothetical protein
MKIKSLSVKISQALLGLIVFSPVAAIAQSNNPIPSLPGLPRNDWLVKDSTTTSPRTRVFVQLPQAGTAFTVDVLAPTNPRSLALNACGWGTWKLPASAITAYQLIDSGVEKILVHGSTVPTCTTNASDPIGTALFDPSTKTVYYKGGTTAGASVISVQRVIRKNLKANSCGQLAFAVPPGTLGYYGTFNVGGTIAAPVPTMSGQFIGAFYQLGATPEVAPSDRTVCRKGVLFSKL